ncbi:MAG: thioredoxin fold domain-containing protein [Balneolaceae bacterium]
MLSVTSIKAAGSIILAGIIFVSGLSPSAAQDPPEDNLDWVGVERALRLASQNDKLILIDVYAEWCPYCQRMQEEVYPDDSVGALIRKYFIPVRINTESDEPVNYLGNAFTHAEFATALNNQGVPTIYFMNQQGEVVGQQPGFLPVDVFSSLLEYVGSGAFENQTFEEFENR